MELDLISRLKKGAPGFSKSQKAIATYIVEHCDKAAFLTANRLGEAVNVSESTVVRFAVRLGYDGYPELQYAVQELIRNRLNAAQRLEVTTAQLNKRNILQSVMREDMEHISTTLSLIDHNVFNDALERLLDAKRIYIVGVRSSSALAEFMYFYFNLIFDSVRLLNSLSSCVLTEQLLRASKGDVAVGISFPRYSQITVEALEYAKMRGASVISITDGPMSPITHCADCALFVKSDTASFVDSLVAPMSLINALVVASGMRRKDELARAFGDLEQIWDKYEVYRKDVEND